MLMSTVGLFYHVLSTWQTVRDRHLQEAHGDLEDDGVLREKFQDRLLQLEWNKVGEGGLQLWVPGGPRPLSATKMFGLSHRFFLKHKFKLVTN